MLGDSLFYQVGYLKRLVIRVLHSKPLNHHLNRVESCNGIHYVLPGVLWRGAVNRLKQAVDITDVCTSSHTHATLQHTSKIGDDITEHVGCDHDIEPLRVADHPHGEGVDVSLFTADFRVGLPHLPEDLTE